MAIVTSYFSDFLSKIRLQQNHIDDLKCGHTTLRDRLLSYDDLKDVVIGTFLQGSYKRHTAIRPHSDSRADVDLIVVTNLSSNEVSPLAALNKFFPFLNKYYSGKYKINGRSIAIELSYVDLDLVVTSAPSEAELSFYKTASNSLIFDDRSIDLLNQQNAQGWKLSPLLIPDRDVNEWTPTHPMEQIRWAQEKNQLCNGHYVNVIKSVKWWRCEHKDKLPKYPKGYPLEHIIGLNCPNSIDSVAEGFTLSLEAIVDKYQNEIIRHEVPFLSDHGVPEHNVFKRITWSEFKQFYDMIANAAKNARQALDETDIEKSVGMWRELLGSKFPEYSGGGNRGGFIPSSGPSNPQKTQRFA